MAQQVFATKGNLIAYKKSLDLAKIGYDLLDRKRNILIREMTNGGKKSLGRQKIQGLS